MTTIDPTPAHAKKDGNSPVVPEQRQHHDASLTQKRVDSIFRALVVRRAVEQRELRAKKRERPDTGA